VAGLGNMPVVDCGSTHPPKMLSTDFSSVVLVCVLGCRHSDVESMVAMQFVTVQPSTAIALAAVKAKPATSLAAAWSKVCDALDLTQQPRSKL
jgi:hypothetical protein